MTSRTTIAMTTPTTIFFPLDHLELRESQIKSSVKKDYFVFDGTVVSFLVDVEDFCVCLKEVEEELSNYRRK